MHDPTDKVQATLEPDPPIDIVRCVPCGGVDLVFHSQGDRNNGHVVCRTCGHHYAVRNGIVDALVPSPAIESERKGNLRLVAEDRAKADDTWLLGLPATFAALEPRLASHAAYNALGDYEQLVELLALPLGASVLDLGAGCCWTTWRLAQRGWRAIATDVSKERFVGLASGDVYMRHCGVYFHRILFDMSAPWPIRDNLVDAIMAFSSIHHAVDLAYTFREAARVLVPGGRFGFVEATKGLFMPWDQSFGNYEREHFGWNEHVYTLPSYWRMARSAGLRFRVFPAPSTLQKMDMLAQGDEDIQSFNTAKWRFARRLCFLWSRPAIRRLINGPVYPLLCLAIGLQFVGLCTKPDGS